jgi:DNA-binding response OmpR family regulator
MLRRPRGVPAFSDDSATGVSPPRVFGDLRINIDSREVHLADAPIMLTRTEFDLLAALSSSPGRVLSRRQLLETAWGETWVGNDNLVDVHVGHLRRKLRDNPTSPRYVTTVRGVGYRMGSC